MPNYKEIDQAVKKVVDEYGDALRMLGEETTNFDKTLEEGLKEANKELDFDGEDWDVWPNECRKEIKQFITTFAHKIRESVEKDKKI